jgi:hypothetical protein
VPYIAERNPHQVSVFVAEVFTTRQSPFAYRFSSYWVGINVLIGLSVQVLSSALPARNVFFGADFADATAGQETPSAIATTPIREFRFVTIAAPLVGVLR